MRVTIVGPGNMGRGISTRLLAGGHSVTLVGRDREQAEALAAELAPGAGGEVHAAGEPGEVVPGSDVVILALPYPATLEFARENGGLLAGKVVVDISNPLNERFDGLVTEPGTSAAETIRALLPPDVRLVKAFNTTFAGTLVQGSVAGQALDVFIASDNEDAARTVAELVRTGGMRPVVLGGLERARELEALGFLGIVSQERLGTNFSSGWKLLLPGVPAHEPHRGFPRNAVVGVLDDPATAGGLVSALAQAGMGGDSVEVLYGREGREHIESSTEGGRGLLEMLMGFEQEHTEQHLRELDAGHAVVVVQSDDGAVLDRAAEIIAAHGGRFVNRYSRWVVANVVP